MVTCELCCDHIARIRFVGALFVPTKGGCLGDGDVLIHPSIVFMHFCILACGFGRHLFLWDALLEHWVSDVLFCK